MGDDSMIVDDRQRLVRRRCAPHKSEAVRIASSAKRTPDIRKKVRRKRVPRAKYRRMWLCLLFLLPAVLLSFFCFMALRGCGADMETADRTVYRFSPQDTSVISGRTEENESSSRPVPASEQDLLLLVNRDHPLSREYIPETAALRYGMAASRLCLDDLQEMMDDCRAAGLHPLICSSYRSYEKQEELYQAKVLYYRDQGKLPSEAAALASSIVAPPGESEHQTGLAFDIVDEGYQLLDEKQETTKVSLWLRENSVRYGFVVRYPPDKTEVTGIIYEPWHYRYVGREHASAMAFAGWTLEEYLENISRN